MLASHPAAPGSILGVTKNVSLDVEGVALNSGHRLDNVNQTHLVRASGMRVLQKELSGNQDICISDIMLQLLHV